MLDSKSFRLLLLFGFAAVLFYYRGGEKAEAPWAPEVLQLDDASFASVKAEHPWALLVVTADWCPPCKVLKPRINQLAPGLADRCPVIALDYDRCPKTVDFYGLQGVPAMLILRNGKEMERRYGPAAVPEIKQWLDEVMAKTLQPAA